MNKIIRKRRPYRKGIELKFNGIYKRFYVSKEEYKRIIKKEEEQDGKEESRV